MSIVDHVQDFYGLEDFSSAANMIGLRMSGDEVVELLDVVPLECFDNSLSLGCVARVEQHGFAGRRGYANRVAVDSTNIENANRQLTTRGRRRLRAPPRQHILPADKSAGAGNDQQNSNC